MRKIRILSTAIELIDIALIQRALMLAENARVSKKDCRTLWSMYSGLNGSNWLYLPRKDADIVAALRPLYVVTDVKE